jgi:hypothetical protein
VTATACGEIRRHDAVFHTKSLDRSPDLDHLTYKFVAQHHARLCTRKITADHMKVGAANAGEPNSHNGICIGLELRSWHIG